MEGKCNAPRYFPGCGAIFLGLWDFRKEMNGLRAAVEARITFESGAIQ
jgi:hypothetical protein